MYKPHGVHHKHYAAKYENKLDFQYQNTIMIKEIPYIWGDFTRRSQNIHFMFVECSIGFEYTIDKESCGFLHHNMSPVTVLTGR